jgi:hypothetical protein
VNARTASLVALLVAGLALGLSVGEVLIVAVGQGLPFNEPEQPAIIDYVANLLFPIVAGLIGYKRPGNRVGWLLLGYSMAVAVAGFTGAWGLYGVELEPGSLPLAGAALWAGSCLWMGGLAFLPLLFLRFPTGELLSPRWRWVQWLCLLPLGIVVVPAVGLFGEPATLLVGLFDDQPAERIEWAFAFFQAALIALVVVVLLSVISLVLRYRRSPGAERLQLKWVLWAAGIVVLSGLWETFLGSSGFSAALSALAFAALPASIAVAILRYRLYEIDRLINRTLGYGVLTAFLATAYLGIVVALQNLIPGGGDSDLTIAGSTLAVAALFRPLRARIQGFIDRRFYRGKFDTQRTLESFSSRLREDVDLDHLSADLLGVVRDTMQPAHASLWLKEKSA